MATAVKTYNFTGSAEGWSPTVVSGACTLAYANNRLDYSGETGRNKAGEGYFSISGTFASIFGIGTGDTVTGYSAASFNGGCDTWVSGNYFYEGDVAGANGALYINDGTTRSLIADQADYAGTGTHTPSVDPGISGLSLAGSTSITLYIYWSSKNVNNASAQIEGYVDDISVTIDYTVAGTTTTTTVAPTTTSTTTVAPTTTSTTTVAPTTTSTTTVAPTTTSTTTVAPTTTSTTTVAPTTTSTTTVAGTTTTTTAAEVTASPWKETILMRYTNGGWRPKKIKRHVSGNWVTSKVNRPSTGLLDGLISVWELDETAGGTAYDLHGSYDGTNNGAAVNQTGTGNIDPVYYFDGSDYITISDNANLRGFSTMSISAWVKMSSWGTSGSTDQDIIIQMGDTTPGSTNYYFRFDGTVTSDKRALYFAGSNTQLGTSSTLALDTWYHLVVTYAGSDNTIIYANNVDVTSSTSSADGIGDTSYTLYVGGRTSLDQSDGYFGQIAVWGDRVLAPSDVGALYNSGSGLDYLLW